MSDELQKLEPGWSTYEDEAGEWRWRYVSPHNGNILAVASEGYHNEGDCIASMDAVKLAGAVAVTHEHPVEQFEALSATATVGFDLPDPLPTMPAAALELRNAQRAYNIAEQNLNHATDANAERYATEYVDAEQRFNRAISVVEAIRAISVVEAIRVAEGEDAVEVEQA